MKKYRLKKVYPGVTQFKVGDIAEKVTIQGKEEKTIYNLAVTREDFPFEYNRLLLSQEDVENNPEYWELVVEKDWEILCFKKDGYYEKFDIYFSKISDDYGDFSNTKLTEEELLKDKNVLIYKVKRKDGEIFTIGDEISDLDEGIAKISNIIYINDSLSIEVKGPYIKGNMSISSLKKVVKAKPFITEDGKELVARDIVYGVHINQYTIHIENITCCKEKCYPDIINLNFFKWFSSEHKAKEYIILNKLIFSVQDIKDMNTKLRPLYSLLEEEAKQRIKF